jgi:hypothetical protein
MASRFRLMGHERRFRAVREMSAYPLTAAADIPQPPLGANNRLMQRSNASLVDHLVGP